MNRRDFLKGLAAAAVAPALFVGFEAPALAGPVEDFWRRNRDLWLKRPATGEEIHVVYWRPETGLDLNGYVHVCRILRDVRANETVRMNPDLLDILYAEQGWLREWGYYQPTLINSGYRNFTTNSMTEGAVKDSEHTKGNAVDKRIPGVPTAYLGKLNRYMTDGGVGVYQGKQFVHVDTGEYRSWKG